MKTLIAVLLLSTVATAEPLSLADAERIALANQPSLRAARANTAAAQARVMEQRGPLLPQVNAGIGFGLGTQNAAGQTLDFSPTPSLSANLSASQLVFDFGKTWFRYQSAEASARAQEKSEVAAGQGVLFDVRTAYFAACASQALVAVAKEALASQEKHLAQIEGFVEVGTRPAIDLAQARTLKANARVQLINAQAADGVARAQLALAMGVERDSAFTVADQVLTEVRGEGEDLKGLFAEALSHRPELQSLEQQVLAQELSLGSTRGSYFPSLGIAAGASSGGSRLDPPGVNWTLGATLSWNLFNGLSTRGQEGQAVAAVDAARAQTDALRQQVRLAVERARLNVGAAKEGLSASEEARTSAGAQLALAEGRYQTGVGTVLELADAQLALTQSSAQVVQARFNLSTARAALLQALGRAEV